MLNSRKFSMKYLKLNTFLLFFVVTCFYNPTPITTVPPERTDWNYDRKKRNDWDRDDVISRSSRRFSGRKCVEENRRHKCREQCEDIYSRRGDSEDCIEDLNVRQIEKLWDLYEILRDPDEDDLGHINPEDFDVYLNISIQSFDKLIKKYKNREAEDILFWIIGDEDIAKIFEKEDDDPPFKTLDTLFERFSGRIGKVWEPFLERLGRDEFMEVVIDSKNSDFLLDWFQDYIEDRHGACKSDTETPACFAVYCKIGSEISSGSRGDWLKYNRKFESYLEDIIDKKVNSENWNTGRIEVDHFELSDVNDWLRDLCDSLTDGSAGAPCSRTGFVRNALGQCVDPNYRPVGQCSSSTAQSVCGSNEYCNSGRCRACPGAQVPNTAKTACETPPQCTSSNVQSQCASSQICSNGRCRACSGSQVPNNARTACETCPSGQVPNSGGTACETCPSDEVPNSGRTACVACPSAQVPNNLGTACASCPSGQVPNSGGTACETCPSGQVPNSSGTACETCPSGQVPNSGRTACVACPSGQVPNNDNTACVTPVTTSQCTSSNARTRCSSNHICNTNTGQCVPCTGSQIPNRERTVCETPPQCTSSNVQQRCHNNQICSNGQCSICSSGQVPNSARTGCQACTGNTVPNQDSSACVACTGNKVPNSGNTACIACTGGKVPNSAGTECVASLTRCTVSNAQSQCESDEYCNASGVCQECPRNSETEGPNSGRTKCNCRIITELWDGSKCVQCARNENWSYRGRCEVGQVSACSSRQDRAWNGISCFTEENCNFARQTIQDGKCVPCTTQQIRSGNCG